jgi:hypothetical protein
MGEGGLVAGMSRGGRGGYRSVTCEHGRGRMARVSRARGCGPTGESRELGRSREKQCDFLFKMNFQTTQDIFD